MRGTNNVASQRYWIAADIFLDNSGRLRLVRLVERSEWLDDKLQAIKGHSGVWEAHASLATLESMLACHVWL